MASKRTIKKFSETYIDTLSKLYHYSTSIYPDNKQSAIAGGEGGYTYKEFKRTVDGLSKVLSCYGVGSGD